MDFNKAANNLGVEVAVVRALTEVESRGSGFLASGEPKILFERHWMYKLLKRKLGKEPAINDVCNPKAGGYLGGSAEHKRLAKAVEIDRDCALQSASWGMFQIMGFHWESLGYPSLQAFINAQYKDEDSQLDSFVRFIKSSPPLLAALKAKDWKRVARLYNGPDYEKNDYDVKLEQAYRKFK